MKILVELLHGLGDTVCALPMLKITRDNYPNAEIYVVVKSKAQADLVYASRIKINEIIYWDVHRCSLIENFKMIKYLRSYKFDYGISSVNTPVHKARIFMGSLKCKNAIGIQHIYGKTFDDLKDKYHFVEANLLTIKSICSLPNFKVYPKLYANDKDIDYVQDKIRKLNPNNTIIGVCIGNGDYSLKNRWLRTGKVITKGWGIENTNDLIVRLLKSKHNVILFGGAMEKELLMQLDEKVLRNENLVNLVAETNVSQSIAAAAICDLVVGVDTGMQHISAAVGAKTLTIFGPTSPKMCGAYSESSDFVEVDVICKYCYGTKAYVNCNDRKCLKDITVDMVVEKINNFFGV